MRVKLLSFLLTNILCIYAGECQRITNVGCHGIGQLVFVNNDTLIAVDNRHKMTVFTREHDHFKKIFLNDIARQEWTQKFKVVSAQQADFADSSCSAKACNKQFALFATAVFTAQVTLKKSNNSQMLPTQHANNSYIESLAFSPNGKLLASGASDNSICLTEINLS